MAGFRDFGIGTFNCRPARAARLWNPLQGAVPTGCPAGYLFTAGSGSALAASSKTAATTVGRPIDSAFAAVF